MIRYRPGIVRVLVALTLFLTVNGFVSAGPTYSQIISFGDSLTDVGNDYFLSGNTQPPSSLGYDNGRASNGPLWVEDLATKLGIAAPTTPTAARPPVRSTPVYRISVSRFSRI